VSEIQIFSNLSPEQLSSLQRMWDRQASVYEYGKNTVAQRNPGEDQGRNQVDGPIRPEQDVVDEIDALVNESLQRGLYCECGDPDDCMCDEPSDDMPKCELCHCDWHGLESSWGCPGAYSTAVQKRRYHESRSRRVESNDSESVTWSHTLREMALYGEVFMVRHGGTDVFRVVPQPNRGSEADIFIVDEVHEWVWDENRADTTRFDSTQET
jgi:hypothetical protein